MDRLEMRHGALDSYLFERCEDRLGTRPMLSYGWQRARSGLLDLFWRWGSIQSFDYERSPHIYSLETKHTWTALILPTLAPIVSIGGHQHTAQ